MENKLLIILFLISYFFAYINCYAEALTVNDNSLNHFQPMIAMLCGYNKYHNKYLNEQKQWITDKDPSAVCMKDKLEILEYCRKVYPKKDIRNIVESNIHYIIENWKPINNNHYYEKHFVKPIRCLEGNFQSDALLVPEHCLFDHIRNTSICESTNYWNKTAAQNCKTKGKILQNYAMLLPCGVGIFNGVEFVCCPSNSISNQLNSETDKTFKENENINSQNIDPINNIINKMPIDKLKDKIKKNKKLPFYISAKVRYYENKYNNDDNDDDNLSLEDEKDDKNENFYIKYDDQNELDFNTKNDKVDFENNNKQNEKKQNSKKTNKISDKDDDDDEYYEDDYDEKDIDSSKSSSILLASSTTTTSTTTTSTTTTETPLEHYYSHFDAKNEHQLFKLAEDFLKKIQLEKMKKIFKNYSEFQNMLIEKTKKSKNNKKYSKNSNFLDNNLDENLSKTMEKRYENTLENLEIQNNEEKQQLNVMHQQRVLTLINMKKQEATDCYTNALNQYPLKTKKIQKCLEKLMKSLEKDRIHTLHHYKHLLMISSKLAFKEKAATLTHLENLIVIANRSISMLNKYPTLNEKIRDHIIAFWHNLRGVPFNQVINRETEQAIMERYEEEFVQKQLKKDHKIMQEKVEEEKTIENDTSKFKINKQNKLKLKKETNKQINEKIFIKPENNLEKESTLNPIHEKIIFKNKKTNNHAQSKKQKSLISKLNKQNQLSDSLFLLNQSSILIKKFEPEVAKLQISRTDHELNYILKEQAPEPHHLINNLVTQSIWKNKHAYLTLSVACIAIFLITIFGIVFYCNSVRQSPISQGFVAVKQQQQINTSALNEHQHVEALQINGYENPTYKYFETNII